LKKSSGIIHGIAECDDCDFTYSNYKNILGVCARHAKLYGHKVRVEIGTSIIFDGR